MDGPNPFDQFAEDFRAAIPGAAPASNDFPNKLTMGPPQTPAPAPAEPKPPMNPAPPMNQGPPMNMYGGFGGPPPMGGGGMGPGPSGMGGPPPLGMGMLPGPGGMGGPPPLGMMQQPSFNGLGGPPPNMGGPPPPFQPQGGMNGMGGGGPPPMNGSMTGALVPSNQPSNPYGGLIVGGPPPPQMGNGLQGGPPPPAPMGNQPWGQQQLQPWGMPPGGPSMGGPPAGPPPPGPAPTDFFGGPPQQFGGPPPPAPAPAPEGALVPAPEGALVPAPAQPSLYEQSQPPSAAPSNNFDMFGAPSPAPPAPAAAPFSEPWGQPPPPAPAPAPTAIVPAPAPISADLDPFGGIFDSAPAPAAPVPAAAPAPSGDMWADIGFGGPPPPAPDSQVIEDDNTTLGGGTIADMAQKKPQQTSSSGVQEDFYSDNKQAPPVAPNTRQPGQLPDGGEYFDARIFTPTLGVMFFKPQELTDSLFLNTDREIVDALEERPVVAFIVEGSSARCAGVELGNVLLKVNGIEVKSPKEASRLIKEGPRPLPLLFYVPNTQVVVAEGEHMVKYDTKDTGAPLSAKDWKPKYVVIGGIIAQPWMMNMYRSKAEYDIAVIETQARRPVSVKVKQFSLQGARIQNDWQGPQMVKYKNKLHPWKYIVILPVSRNPIKISSTNLSQLKPVHEGIRRVIAAQQRGATAHIPGPTAAPIQTSDPYSAGGGGGGGTSSAPPPTEGGVGSVRRKTPF